MVLFVNYLLKYKFQTFDTRKGSLTFICCFGTAILDESIEDSVLGLRLQYSGLKWPIKVGRKLDECFLNKK